MTGLELQTRLANKDGPPIIFLTGHGDIPTTVKAMKGGATEFLLKPFDEDDLVRAIDAAIAFVERAEEDSLRDFKSLYATLTPREREVFAYVIAAGGLRPRAPRWNITQPPLQELAQHVSTLRASIGGALRGIKVLLPRARWKSYTRLLRVFDPKIHEVTKGPVNIVKG